MNKALFTLLATALLIPVVTQAQTSTKHHLNRDAADISGTFQYQNTPDYSGERSWSTHQQQWRASLPKKTMLGRDHHTEQAMQSTQYHNTPSYQGTKADWQIRKEEWKNSQPTQTTTKNNK